LVEQLVVQAGGSCGPAGALSGRPLRRGIGKIEGPDRSVRCCGGGKRSSRRKGWHLSGRGSSPLASNRSVLTGDPQPRRAGRTGFPLIGTGFRLNRTAEPPVRSAERMNGCAERTDRTAVPSKICGEGLNARGFRLARSPVRTNRTWERMNGSPEPMLGNRERLLVFAERLSIRRGKAGFSPSRSHPIRGGAVEWPFAPGKNPLAAAKGGWAGERPLSLDPRPFFQPSRAIRPAARSSRHRETPAYPPRKPKRFWGE
jgi:hypothetical protein